MKIEKLKRRNWFISEGNMRIGKLVISAEYQMDEQFQNLLIFGAKFGFSKLKEF